jgi:hypothetical protein
MERRRRLADPLAVATGEFLADVLDYLPLPRNDRIPPVWAALPVPAEITDSSMLD